MFVSTCILNQNYKLILLLRKSAFCFPVPEQDILGLIGIVANLKLRLRRLVSQVDCEDTSFVVCQDRISHYELNRRTHQ